LGIRKPEVNILCHDAPETGHALVSGAVVAEAALGISPEPLNMQNRCNMAVARQKPKKQI